MKKVHTMCIIQERVQDTPRSRGKGKVLEVIRSQERFKETTRSKGKCSRNKKEPGES